MSTESTGSAATPNPLNAIEFDPDRHADLVKGFSCGDEAYEQDLARWLREDAAQTLAGGGKVWLYATEAKEIVGFGSLAITRWNFPESASNRVSLALIPAVALQKQFWGKPDGPRENRYSSQILDHLLTEAARLKIDVPILGLFVHPENKRAIKAYERAGFTLFAKTYFDKATGVIYLSMLRPIVAPPG
ncbi:MAG: GNAT family N-acetyltransferase [Planctomycetes bacterium]|nr:GNAT family N-acetyltransferase [Planctomycetota bacterium]